MSQQAVADSSIRLVQEPTAPQHNSSFIDAGAQGRKLPLPGFSASQAEGPNDITITTSLEVPSASPFSAESKNMASKGHATHVQPPSRPPRSIDRTVQVSRTATAPNSMPSQLPPTAPLGQVVETAADSIKSGAHPTNAQDQEMGKTTSMANSKLPEFRQSRRWAKFHAMTTSKILTEPNEEQCTAKTMRETSFEQQRAQRKTSIHSPRAIPRAASRALSETESLIQAQGLCRTMSMPTWQVLKTARLSRPHSLPPKWVSRKLSIRRHRRTTSRQSMSNNAGEVVPSLRKSHLRRRIRPQKAVADLRNKAGFASSSSKVADINNVVDLDRVRAHFPTERRSSSPVPSLHDPAKAKIFSQECEALLSNPEFDKDWGISSTKPLPPLRIPFEKVEAESRPRPSTSWSMHNPRPDPISDASTSRTEPHSTFEARKAPETLPGLTAPDAPVRKSSKGGSRLFAHMTRSACIPILHDSRDGALIGLGHASDASSTTRPSLPHELDTPSKMPSATEPERRVKGPRPVASTDTLSRIEAEVQERPHTAIAERLKSSTAFIIGSPKRPNTASGTPPERPLPALPALPAPSFEERASSDSRLTDARPQKNPRHVPTNSTRSLQDISALKALTIEAIDTRTLGAESSSSLPRPGSSCSQSSVGSFHISHHDKDQLLPVRSCRVKRRVQADMTRQRRISEDDESRLDSLDPADRPLPPVPPLEQPRGVVDMVDQFPSVPISRPQSQASFATATKRPQSKTKGHARHSSRASSVQPRRAYQTLAVSEIKVLVDTNPVTGSFRAGAMSPSPSTAGSSRDGSPEKARRGLSQTSFRGRDVLINGHTDATNRALTRLPSIRSPRSQTSPRHVATRKLLRRGSVANDPDSADDTNTLLCPARSIDKVTNAATTTKKSHTRNKSNVSDLHDVPSRKDDAENLYEMIFKLANEMRLQREEARIQKEETAKMARVFASMTHANGLRGARYAVQPVVEGQREEAQRMLAREVEVLAAAKGKGKMSNSRRERAMSRKSLEMKVRPISDGSSTSAPTNITCGSWGANGRGSMEGEGERSMTDPLEYDLPLPVSVSAPAGLEVEARKAAKSRSRKGSRLGSQGSMSAMHVPPPVATRIPKGRLAEETESGRLRLWCGESGVEEERGVMKEGEVDDYCRLSVNHGFTDTEMMDRAIEVFQSYA
jgi:hypothetical protein